MATDLCTCADCCFARAWYFRVHIHEIDRRVFVRESSPDLPAAVMALMWAAFTGSVEAASVLDGTGVVWTALLTVSELLSRVRMLQPRTWSLTFSGLDVARVRAIQPSRVAPYILWVMCNPSDANEEDNDHTVRRVQSFTARLLRGQLEGARGAIFDASRRYRYVLFRPGFLVVNFYALVSTHPEALANVEIDPFGPENEEWIRKVSRHAFRVVIACGAPPKNVRHFDAQMSRAVDAVAAEHSRPLLCLGTTAKGYPRHPSRLPDSATFEPWTDVRCPACGSVDCRCAYHQAAVAP